MAWKIRQDERVVVIERVNIRDDRRRRLIPEPVDLVVIDVSFISLEKVLPCRHRVPEACEADLIALIKPQFEVGRDTGGQGRHRAGRGRAGMPP